MALAQTTFLSSRVVPSLGLNTLRPRSRTPLAQRAAARRPLACRADASEPSTSFQPRPNLANTGASLVPSARLQQTKLPDGFPLDLVSSLMDILKKALKPALVTLMVTALLWAAPNMAEAAQGGGRVGGKGFSASRSRTYSAPSQRYSAPSAPTIIAPSYSVPFFAPMPFFGFGPTIVVGGGGGGSLFSFLFLGIVAFFVLNAVLNFFGQQAEEEVWEAQQRSSVVRLQVGLMGTARQLQKDLERMASRADTNSEEGLHYILQESVLALLRNPDFCIYGYSTSEVCRDSYEGEQSFNRVSMEERSKFKEETLVSVGDVRKRVSRVPTPERMNSEYIVVTLLAACEGDFTLPEIKSSDDLRNALTKLGSITAEELQAIEILWTPENEEDTLSARDLLQDYPLLRPL